MGREQSDLNIRDKGTELDTGFIYLSLLYPEISQKLNLTLNVMIRVHLFYIPFLVFRVESGQRCG